MTPHEMTREEVQEEFLLTIEAQVDFWERQAGDTVREKLVGLAFSFLVLLDGEAMGLPKFKVVPDPHPDDQQTRCDGGENWFPANLDIAGDLHEEWSTRDHHWKP